jgi:hypothetical protein
VQCGFLGVRRVIAVVAGAGGGGEAYQSKLGAKGEGGDFKERKDRMERRGESWRYELRSVLLVNQVCNRRTRKIMSQSDKKMCQGRMNIGDD